MMMHRIIHSFDSVKVHLETGLTQDIENITTDNSAANYVTKWSPTAERKIHFTKVEDQVAHHCVRNILVLRAGLSYLRGCLTGDALRSVIGLSSSNADFELAGQKLKERFDWPYMYGDEIDTRTAYGHQQRMDDGQDL
ncbi:hypothetical protein T11_17654 [Trichinella zimbabwensis]|uniref:Uncharacterized protein n=1 Tax=Trichinella zimbabwensis TaxID=268475 RepID=A0A0V1I4T8_9BILA|nr:hypothetical protein T11_17654 [Trichinella zimbabwensis]